MSPKSEMLFLYTSYIQPRRLKSDFFHIFNFLFRIKVYILLCGLFPGHASPSYVTEEHLLSVYWMN